MVVAVLPIKLGKLDVAITSSLPVHVPALYVIVALPIVVTAVLVTLFAESVKLALPSDTQLEEKVTAALPVVRVPSKSTKLTEREVLPPGAKTGFPVPISISPPMKFSPNQRPIYFAVVLSKGFGTSLVWKEVSR